MKYLLLLVVLCAACNDVQARAKMPSTQTVALSAQCAELGGRVTLQNVNGEWRAATCELTK